MRTRRPIAPLGTAPQGPSPHRPVAAMIARASAAAAGVGLAVSLTLTPGCAQGYVTPGTRAEFAALGITPAKQAALTDSTIAEKLSRRPAASFPAIMAVARVQDGGYSSHSYRSQSDGGAVSLIARRELDAERIAVESLSRLPLVRSIAPLNRLVAMTPMRTERDLREAAAAVQADVLLLYTFDTQFLAADGVPLVGVISLGLLPDRAQRVRSTCASVLMDTRTGFVYAIAEGTAERSQVANAWGSAGAAEAARLSAEGDALAQAAEQMAAAWPRVVAAYGPPSGQPAAQVFVPAPPPPPPAPAPTPGWTPVTEPAPGARQSHFGSDAAQRRGDR